MRRTPNPCWNDGRDCPDRSAECRISCEKWKEDREKHQEEKDAIFRQKQSRNDVEAFMCLQGERARTDSARKSAKRMGKTRE